MFGIAKDFTELLCIGTVYVLLISRQEGKDSKEQKERRLRDPEICHN